MHVDQVKRLFNPHWGNKVQRNNVEKIAKVLDLDPTDIVESNQWHPPQRSTIGSELPDSEDILTSAFYLKREPHESQCYEAILKPGALIRVKAPQQMGKTWLMERVLNQAREQGYRTQTLSFELADSTVFSDLRKFFQWFCASTGESLGLENKLTDFWDDMFGCNKNSTVYFQKYLLATIGSPLILALDKVDLVFDHPEIANDFCCLLRGWYDMARRGDKSSTAWKQLRLVVVHSTEVYGLLDINRSPLGGVGVTVRLPGFTPEQVDELVKRHGLNWNPNQLKQLRVLVEGHPYLVREGLEYIACNKVTLEQFLQVAPTDAGPYSDHLRRHLGILQRQPNLLAAFKEVVTTTSPVRIDSFQAFQLDSMGLVHLQANSIMPRCDLYRLYFCDRL